MKHTDKHKSDPFVKIAYKIAVSNVMYKLKVYQSFKVYTL